MKTGQFSAGVCPWRCWRNVGSPPIKRSSNGRELPVIHNPGRKYMLPRHGRQHLTANLLQKRVIVSGPKISRQSRFFAAWDSPP